MEGGLSSLGGRVMVKVGSGWVGQGWVGLGRVTKKWTEGPKLNREGVNESES